MLAPEAQALPVDSVHGGVAPPVAYRLYKLLIVTMAVWAGIYARVSVGPIQEALRLDLALSDNQIAILQGPAAAVAILLGAIPAGLLIDRFSRARLLILFAAMALVGSVMTAATSTFAILFLARSIVGLSAIATLICGYSLLSDLYPPAQRGRATMLLATSELGWPVAFAIGGWLLAAHGQGNEGWRWALVWMCGPPLVAVMLVLLLLREPPRLGTLVEKPPVRKAFGELWQIRRVVVPLLVARCLVGAAEGSIFIWAAPLLSRRFDLGPDHVGAMIAAVTLVSSVAPPLLGGLVADYCQRWGGPRRTMQALAVLALLSAPFSLFAIAPTPLLVCVLLALFGSLGGSVNIAGATLAIILVPNEVRATYLSLTMIAGAVCGTALAPLAASLLSGALGGTSMIGPALALICLSFSLLAVLIFTLGSRNIPRGAGA